MSGSAAARDGAPLLEVRGVVKKFGGVIALNEVDLVVPRGAIIGLIGPNGAGKTTFFNVVTGLSRPDQRPDHLRGPEPGRPAPQRDRGPRHRAHLPVHPALPVHDRAGERPGRRELPADLERGSARCCGRRRWWRRRRRPATGPARCSTFVGLADKGADLARNLPYGDQRRLEIARALATEPRLLLLDEPTAGMNPQETETLTQSDRPAAARAGTLSPA